MQKFWQKLNRLGPDECPSAKLTAAAVLAIRRSALPNKLLAEQFGVSQMTVSNIKRRVTWTHVD